MIKHLKKAHKHLKQDAKSHHYRAFSIVTGILLATIFATVNHTNAALLAVGEEIIITPIVVGEEGEIGEPLPVACDYAAPPMGCNYVAGPSYNAMTNCGMILNCGDGGDEIGPPLPVACDYAAPPMGCNYVPGPSYNAMTNCGKILSCMNMEHEPYTITLLAGSGGTLVGDTVQNIGSESASNVTAVPNSGYVFTSWSNGSTANPLNPGNIDNPTYVDMTITANFAPALLYTDPNGIFSFYYLGGLQYKNSSRGSVKVVFTSLGSKYNGAAPLITVAKGASNKTVAQLQAGAVISYRKLLRNNLTVTSEIERTANGAPVKQLHFTGKIGKVSKTFIVAFVRQGSDVYVLSLNGTSQYAAVLDEAIDTMVNTWTFLPQQLEPVCLSCIPIGPGVEVEPVTIP